MAIETSGLTKVYDTPQGWRKLTRPKTTTAVADITFSVPEGEIFGLLGPNGAGKTTLTKMLCTLIIPTAGSACVAGHDLSKSGAIRATVGLVVADERSFYWRLSARRNLNFFAAMHGLHGQAARKRIDTVLADVDLLHLAEQRFSSFSSGMRQRLAIARSLLHMPNILFLDEPSRSLDPKATDRLHHLIQRLREQHQLTVFLITHDLAEAEKLCHRVALLHRGRVRAVGKPTQLRHQLSPQRRYTIVVELLDAANVDLLVQIMPQLEHTQRNGRTLLSFQAGEEDGTLTQILHALSTQQHTIYTVEATLPTLEEVFAHFTRE